MSSEKEEEGVVTFCDGDDVDVVVEGTTKLIIDKSVKNVPEGGEDERRSAFPGYETIEVIVIEEGVKSIGKFSFSKCKNLRAVTFPSTIKEIGERAFRECANLEEVDLSKTKITHINESTFYSCEKLKKIILPSSLVKIGNWAFCFCNNLTTLIIPASVTNIEKAAFSQCEKLIGVTFLSKSTKIHKEAFEICHALPYFMYKNNIQASTETTEDQATETSDKLTITKDVEEEQYLNNDTIRVVEVEEGVKTIGPGAFGECTSLESVKLPESLREVGEAVFYECTSLQEINIPENVTVISEFLFSGCTSLKHLTLSPSTTKIGMFVFNNCTSLKNIELPQTLEIIGRKAFKNCISMKKIEIPKSVKELGECVFVGCTSLEEVKFDKDSEIKIIELGTFSQCSSLKEMKLPSTVTEIKDRAFSECSSLKSINIHDTVTTIGEGAFSGCTSLESIRIPSSITEINESTFKNCTSLTSLTIPRSVNKIEKDAFRDCTSLREVTIQNPDIEIEEGAFAGCDALENIRGLPSSEKNIKSYLEGKVFEGCLSLENPIGNEIHLAAEGKCWEGDEFPQDGHLWIQQALEGKNKERKETLEKASSNTSDSKNDVNEVEPQDASSSSPSPENLKDDSTFQKDYNGNTAFECAVRGGAPLSYLNVLAQGKDENGRTHLDIFADKYARKQPEDFTANELAFLIEQNSKLITATPIGEGNHYIDSLEELLQSPNFDPLKVPEFIHILNDKFKSKRFAVVLMLDFIIPVMSIVSFLMISHVYFEEDEEKEGHANVVWFISMYFTILYLIFREFLQLFHGFTTYLTDPWNWYDIIIIITTTLATIMMHKTDYVEVKENYWVKRFVIFTIFNIWMFVILKTKVLSVNFAKFVSGIIYIIWTLRPFILVSIFMLGAFAHMYFINDRTGDFCSFTQAFLRTYSSLLSFDGLPFLDTVGVFFESANKTVVFDEEDSTDWNEMFISMAFGFFVVILLLNVLIAVLGATWQDISERGRDDFLLYRVRLLLETQDVFHLFDKIHNKNHSIKSSLEDDDKTGIWSLSPDANYNKMWGKSKKFSEVLRRMNLVLFLRIVLNIIYTILGIFLGLTWSTAVRKALFCIDNSQAIADKRNRLQTRLRDTEEEVERLGKIDKHVTENPKDLHAYLIDCVGIPSHFELKKKIGALEKEIKKQKKDVHNFMIWEQKLKGVHKEKKD